METRVCKRCNLEKELNKDNFPSGRYGKNKEKISFERMCKVCKNEEGNLRYHGKEWRPPKPIETHKKCTGGCEIIKEINEDNFYLVSENKFMSTCIECVARKGTEYRLKNKEEIGQRRSERFEALEKINPEDIIPYLKTCTSCNIEKYTTEFTFHIWHNNFISKCNVCCAIDAKKYYQENTDKCLIYAHEYRENNKEKVIEANRIYQKTHKAELTKKATERVRNDPFLKLRGGISSTINRYLKKNGGSKNSSSIMDFLPYTMKDLIVHLESQFEQWMTWENRGAAKIAEQTWNIDHIIPQTMLPYDSMDHINFQRSWAFANLRPLDAIENIRKHNNISDELKSEMLIKIDSELEERANNNPEFRLTLERLKLKELENNKKAA